MKSGINVITDDNSMAKLLNETVIDGCINLQNVVVTEPMG